MTSLGVIYQIACMSDIYITINNDGKLLSYKVQKTIYVQGHHKMRLYIKGQQQ